MNYHSRGTAGDDGWIEWSGGECPVGLDVKVTVRTAAHTFTGPAGSFRWEHVEGWPGVPSTRTSSPIAW